MFSGHTGYIHCLCLKSGGGGSVLSGAEDGTVKMWGELGGGKTLSLSLSIGFLPFLFSPDPASPTAALTWKPAKVSFY